MTAEVASTVWESEESLDEPEAEELPLPLIRPVLVVVCDEDVVVPEVPADASPELELVLLSLELEELVVVLIGVTAYTTSTVLEEFAPEPDTATTMRYAVVVEELESLLLSSDVPVELVELEESLRVTTVLDSTVADTPVRPSILSVVLASSAARAVLLRCVR